MEAATTGSTYFAYYFKSWPFVKTWRTGWVGKTDTNLGRLEAFSTSTFDRDEFSSRVVDTTAQLMDLVPAASLEYKPEVTYFVYDEANRCNNSMAIAATEPPAGGNTGVIGHAGFVCPTLDSLAWGEAAIYKPDGQGGSIYITRVRWNEWNALP